MKTRTATWFETRVHYEKTMEDGLIRKVTETFVVDALSFTEAEAKIIDELASFISGEFSVVAMKIAPYREILFTDNADAEKFYKVKLQFITIDEKTEKEIKTNIQYLVQASSLENARKNVDEVMQNTMIDYHQISVIETSVVDVFQHSQPHKTKEIPVTSASLQSHYGCRLAKSAIRTWKEDFVDEDTGNVVTIDRNDIVLERLNTLDSYTIPMLIGSGIESIVIYDNEPQNKNE